MLEHNQALESKLDIPFSRWIVVNAETPAIFLILVLAIVSRFVGLGDRTISFDEVNHVVPAYSLYSGKGYSFDPLSHGPLQIHMMALSYASSGTPISPRASPRRSSAWRRLRWRCFFIAASWGGPGRWLP